MGVSYFPKYIYGNVFYCLKNGKNPPGETNETEKILLSFQAAIDFMLKHSLTKDTKKYGDDFVVSLALEVNNSVYEYDKNKYERGLEITKLTVEFILKILKNNKMVDREKLFIDTLASRFRPEMISTDHKPEQENSNISGVKSKLDTNQIDNDNRDKQPNIQLEAQTITSNNQKNIV